MHSMSLPVAQNEWLARTESMSMGQGSSGMDTGEASPVIPLSSSLHHYTGPNASLLTALFDNVHGASPTVADFMDSDAARQAQLMYEKRRKRRESHNAVERRRRDHINEKIQELSVMLPEAMSLSDQGGSTYINGKPNKGVVLKKSVDYIRQLQQVIQQQAARNKELEEEVARLRQILGLGE
jgi:hypothetical protein